MNKEQKLEVINKVRSLVSEGKAMLTPERKTIVCQALHNIYFDQGKEEPVRKEGLPYFPVNEEELNMFKMTELYGLLTDPLSVMNPNYSLHYLDGEKFYDDILQRCNKTEKRIESGEATYHEMVQFRLLSGELNTQSLHDEFIAKPAEEQREIIKESKSELKARMGV